MLEVSFWEGGEFPLFWGAAFGDAFDIWSLILLSWEVCGREGNLGGPVALDASGDLLLSPFLILAGVSC